MEVNWKQNRTQVFLCLEDCWPGCVTVMVCLVFYIFRRVSDSSRGIKDSRHTEHDQLRSNQKIWKENVNYASALDFSATNVRHWKKMKYNTECVYSTVNTDSQKQQQL
ncbi:hypothetical protein CHARACLAT_022685 [Characodon lateralis]|uniref:Uncharacterized protein n=1 Tax=Characodon lateralis TaxID=208331 RepID=A0ABU7DMT3_9TELE|nr:hypothetical protein [Characodon lateralis]